MITFNVFGCCVSRDSVELLVQKEKARVLQFASASIGSVFSNPPKTPLVNEDLHFADMSNFRYRSFKLDYNKEILNYIFKKKSDYIIVDIGNSRLNLFDHNGHKLTDLWLSSESRKSIDKYMGEKGDLISADKITDGEWKRYTDKLCDSLLKHYTLQQIILPEFYCVNSYYNEQSGALKQFDDFASIFINRSNNAIRLINSYLFENLKGAHIIEFPKNVIADKNHKWGLGSLHFAEPYYEYLSTAIGICCSNLSDAQEKEQISELKSICEMKFELIIKNAQINKEKTNYKYAMNAIGFTKALEFDRFDDNHFEQNLKHLKEKDLSISILKSSDLAGQILLKAAKKYEINVVYTSTLWDFAFLKAEEFEKCKKADLIISANVHDNTMPEKDGIKAVSIWELLK